MSVQYEYLWADGVKVKKPIKLTAPQYINALFDWIEDQVPPPTFGLRTEPRHNRCDHYGHERRSRSWGVQMDDRSLFPKDAGSTFPANFMDIIKRIFKRLFRVYAHIYHTHFVEVCSLKIEAHLNTCFKHFIFFAKVLLPTAFSRCVERP